MSISLKSILFQIPSYDHSKHFLLELGWFQEGPVLHFLCSIFAGLCVATANNPVDVVKSRMQSEFRKPGVQAKYRNIPQVCLSVCVSVLLSVCLSVCFSVCLYTLLINSLSV